MARAGTPTVTVIIPTRNRVSMARRALQSALAQEGARLEVIVVDDCSSDSTAEVLEGMGDPRIRSIRLPERSGVSAARNAGIRAATGEWLAFLDDDDLWAPGKLRKQLAVARESDASLVYSGVVLLDAAGQPIEPVRMVVESELWPRLLETNLIGTPSAVLARTDIVRRVGAFDEQLASLADWDLWIRLVAVAPAALCAEYLCGYTQHDGAMHLLSPRRLARELEYLRRKHRASADRAGTAVAGYSFQVWLASRYRRAGLTRPAARVYLRMGIRYCRPRHVLRGLALLEGERAARLGRLVAGAAADDAGDPAPTLRPPDRSEDFLSTAASE